MQGEAAEAGGRIITLLGNHEVMNLLGIFQYFAHAEAAMLGATQLPHPLGQGPSTRF